LSRISFALAMFAKALIA